MHIGSYQILPFTQADIPALAAIQPDGWYDIRNAFNLYAEGDFYSVWKLCDGEKIIGTGAIIYFGASTWLGHIIIHTAYRKQGLGKAFTGFLVEETERNRPGMPILLIATPLGLPVYRQCGFTVEDEYLFFRKEESAQQSKAPHPAIVPLTEDTFQEVLAIDKEVSGENRSELLQLYRNEAVCYLEEGAIKGYYFPALREGLLVALHERAGEALLHLRMQKPGDIILPEANQAAISLLEANGYQYWRKGTRMWKNKPVDRKPEYTWSRISGNMG